MTNSSLLKNTFGAVGAGIGMIALSVLQIVLTNRVGNELSKRAIDNDNNDNDVEQNEGGEEEEAE